MTTSATIPITIPTRYRFTVTEYYAMGDAGILHPKDDRVELLDGDIILLPPVQPWHSASVSRLNHNFVPSLQRRAVVTRPRADAPERRQRTPTRRYAAPVARRLLRGRTPSPVRRPPSNRSLRHLPSTTTATPNSPPTPAPASGSVDRFPGRPPHRSLHRTLRGNVLERYTRQPNRDHRPPGIPLTSPWKLANSSPHQSLENQRLASPSTGPSRNPLPPKSVASACATA